MKNKRVYILVAILMLGMLSGCGSNKTIIGTEIKATTEMLADSEEPTTEVTTETTTEATTETTTEAANSTEDGIIGSKEEAWAIADAVFKEYGDMQDFKSYDISVCCYEDDYVVYDVVLYTNIGDDQDNESHTRNIGSLVAHFEDGKWANTNEGTNKESLLDKYSSFIINRYGEEYTYAFMAANYEPKHQKVVRIGLNDDVSRFKKNEDGTISMTLFIGNGLSCTVSQISYSKYDVTFFGDNGEELVVVDITDQLDMSNKVIDSMSYIEVDLVIPANKVEHVFDQISYGRISTSASSKYKRW